MNLIHEGGSNDITLYVNDDLSQELLDKAIKVGLQHPLIWNLHVLVLPRDLKGHRELFVGWELAGHVGEDPPILRFKKSIRRSSDGGVLPGRVS